MSVAMKTIPSNPAWAAYVSERLRWAREVRLVHADAQVAMASARLLLPETIEPDQVAPDQSLRSARKQPIPGPGWVLRPDLFEEAAEWLLANSGKARRILICEDDLSSVSDPHLRNKPWLEFGGRVFYAAPLQQGDAEQLAQTMRWGRRSRRFLGVVIDADTVPSSFDFSRGLFLCDILDCDSLAAVPFQTAS